MEGSGDGREERELGGLMVMVVGVCCVEVDVVMRLDLGSFVSIQSLPSHV